MKKIYLSSVFLSITISCFSQWNQVNNGITNLTSGAKLLNSSNTHLFSGSLGGSKMYKTNDNGNNWTEIQPPVSSNVPECGFYAAGKYFAGLNSSMDCIYYTTDNGTTWNTVIGAPATTVVRGFTSLSGNIYAFTSSKGIYKSTDGGANWSSANTGLSNLNVIALETINTKLIAGTIGGGVFVSSDDGATWVQSNTGIPGGSLNTSLVWRMGTSLYYIEQGGGSYTSSNDGANWSLWSKPAAMGLAVTEVYRKGSNIYFESRHFSAGLKDSLYLSSNEGSSWTNITSNLSATDLNASGITEFGGYAFIAYNISSPGLGIYRNSMPVNINENENTNSISIFPNPFNEIIYFSNSSDIKIKHINIYSIQGKLVLSNESDNAIKTSLLNNGVYTVEIILEDNSSIRKKLIK